MNQLFLVVTLFLSAGYLTASQWPYLNKSPFKIRHQKALEYVQACDTIIEVGGGQNPISQMAKDKKIIVIDPAISRFEEGSIRHIPASIENWNESIPSENYAIVILGLQLEKMQRPGWLKMYALIERASKTVIEYSSENKEARKTFKTICRNAHQIEVCEAVKFDLTESVYLDKIKGKKVYAKRIMHFLEHERSQSNMWQAYELFKKIVQ